MPRIGRYLQHMKINHHVVAQQQGRSTVQCAVCGTRFHWTGMITIYRGQVWCAWCVLLGVGPATNSKGEDARGPTNN